MNGPATARPPERSRLALILAGVLALLGSFVVTAHAQAGYYDDSNYGSYPCSYRAVPPLSLRATVFTRGAHAAAGGGAPPRDQAFFMSVVMSNANMSSGAMVGPLAITAVTIVIRRVIDPGRGLYPWGYGGVRGWRAPRPLIRTVRPIRGAAATRAGLGEGYGWRAPHATNNRPPIDIGEPPRPPAPVWAGPATEPFLMATKTPARMPANAGHTIQHGRHLLLHMEQQMCRTRCRQTVGTLRPACFDPQPGTPRVVGRPTRSPSPRVRCGADREPERVIADKRYLMKRRRPQGSPVRARAQTQSSLRISPRLMKRKNLA